MNEWIIDESKTDSESTDNGNATFFISVNKKDPSEDFMKCLSDLPRKIRKASEEGSRNYYVADRQTGNYSVEFWVGTVHMKGSNLAEVEAGHWCGADCYARIQFTVHRIRGQWRVTRKSPILYY